jgi:hypothetical protein
MRATKRTILIAVTVMCVHMAGVAHAAEPTWTILLVGGSTPNSIQISLSPDGKTYEIDSISSLEVGGKVCWHPGGDLLKLLCDAPSIAAFEVNGEGGNDSLEVSSTVQIPVTLSGGSGDDRLLGGSGEDRMLGGDGFDRLHGGGGGDSILAGSGSDIVIGEWGNDELFGEGGQDSLAGGGGDDSLSGGLRHDSLYGGIGRDRLNGGEGRDSLFGGPGDDRFIGASGDGISGGPGLDVAFPGGAVG